MMSESKQSGVAFRLKLNALLEFKLSLDLAIEALRDHVESKKIPFVEDDVLIEFNNNQEVKLIYKYEDYSSLLGRYPIDSEKGL